MSILRGITPGIYEILESSNGGNPDVGSSGQQLHPIPSNVMEIGLYRDSGTTAATQSAATESWGGIIKESTARINTVLEERSYLDFYFPNSNIGRRRVVFFENPKITEERAPRYASKYVVGRNEPVRLWTGAEARKVKLNFTYTLPHVEFFFRMMGNLPAGFANQDQTGNSPISSEESVASQQMDWRAFTANKMADFFGTDLKANTAGGTLSLINRSKFGPRMYEDTQAGATEVDGFEIVKQNDNMFVKRLINAWATDGEALNNGDMIATYYTQFVIDTLRASVVGDTTDGGNAPVGPPIVRFRHGTVFNEAPFIVKSMNVDYGTESGMEVRTLMPRQVKFTLALEEFRQTYGAQHGEGREAVQGSSNILDLNFGLDSLNVDRERYPRHTS